MHETWFLHVSNLALFHGPYGTLWVYFVSLKRLTSDLASVLIVINYNYIQLIFLYQSCSNDYFIILCSQLIVTGLKFVKVKDQEPNW